MKIGCPPENARSPANITFCSGSQTPTSLVEWAGPMILSSTANSSRWIAMSLSMVTSGARTTRSP